MIAPKRKRCIFTYNCSANRWCINHSCLFAVAGHIIAIIMKQQQTTRVSVSYQGAEYTLDISHDTTFENLAKLLIAANSRRFENVADKPILFSSTRIDASTQSVKDNNYVPDIFFNAEDNVLKTLSRNGKDQPPYSLWAHVVKLGHKHAFRQSEEALKICADNVSRIDRLDTQIARMSAQLNMLTRIMMTMKNIQSHQPREWWRIKYGHPGIHRHIIVIPRTVGELEIYEERCKANIQSIKDGVVLTRYGQVHDISVYENEARRVATTKKFWNNASRDNINPTMLYCSLEELSYHVSSSTYNNGRLDNGNTDDDDTRWRVVCAVGDIVKMRIALVKSSEDFFWPPAPPKTDDDNNKFEDTVKPLHDNGDFIDTDTPSIYRKLWNGVMVVASWTWKMIKKASKYRIPKHDTNRPYFIIPDSECETQNNETDSDSVCSSDDQGMVVNIGDTLVSIEYAEAWCIPIEILRNNDINDDDNGTGPPSFEYEKHLALGGLTIRGKNHEGKCVKIYLPLLELVDDADMHIVNSSERPTHNVIPLSRFSQAFASNDFV